jgi:hypothetical protein
MAQKNVAEKRPTAKHHDNAEWRNGENLLKIQSWKTETGKDIDCELDSTINRLKFIEDMFFNCRDGKERLDFIDKDSFDGLALLLGDATSGAILLRRALFGDEMSGAKAPATAATEHVDRAAIRPGERGQDLACSAIIEKTSGVPDVSCALGMIEEKLEFVIQAGFEAEGGVKELGDKACSGLLSILFGIKWELAEIKEKLYPRSN